MFSQRKARKVHKTYAQMDVYEQTFYRAARTMFLNAPRYEKDGWTYMKVPFEENHYITTTEFDTEVPKVSKKLLASAWFELYKPAGAPELALSYAQIKAYKGSYIPLRRHVGYFSDRLAEDGYDIPFNATEYWERARRDANVADTTGNLERDR